MNVVYKAPCELKPYDKNAKKHDETQVANVAESIRQYGFVQPIVVDRNNVVVIGHCRLMAAKKLKMRSVPCLCVDDLTDEQVKALRIVDNKTNESAWDFDFLNMELPEIDLGAFDFGFADVPSMTEEEHAERFKDDGEDDEYERKAAEFREKMEAGELSDDDEEYQEFLEKFEAKKTTDDCYTPPVVYEAVADYVADKYGVSKNHFVRPFYPGGNYKAEKYKPTDVVVDNPPFSIFSEIVKFYNDNGIRFFLFAPHLTVLGMAKGSASLLCGVAITYENGAVVNTSFVTNMEDCAFRSAPKLYKAVHEANVKNLKESKREIPKYSYPPYLVTATMIAPYSRLGIEFSVGKGDCHFIRQLESQKSSGKAVFGSGYLISERKKAEREKAERDETERVEVWELSDREKKIIESLGSHGGDSE